MTIRIGKILGVSAPKCSRWPFDDGGVCPFGSEQPLVPTSTVDVVPLSAQVDTAMVQERMLATLAGAFGALALNLACVGIDLNSYTLDTTSSLETWN